MTLPLPPHQQTIYAVATPPGRAGIAVIRISGPAAPLVAEHYQAALPAPRKAVFATWRDAEGQQLDQGLMLYFPSPHSFTGEDVIELHCHGGRATLDALQNHLAALPNLRPAEAGEFSRRAYMHGKIDLLEAEGLLDLIHAETEAQRRLALNQMQGHPSRQWQALSAEAMQHLALLEACIDFTDEDIPDELFSQVESGVRDLQIRLQQILKQPSAQKIRDGFRVVIVGPPNAGKSSLLNALSREEAAIVSPLAGTTRDAIEVRLSLHGQLVILTDTAGLRESEDALEREGMRRTHQHQAKSDLRLLMLDGTQSMPTISEWEQFAPVEPIPTLVLLNKSEEMSSEAKQSWQMTMSKMAKEENLLFCSIQNQDGIGAIETWLNQQIENFSGYHGGDQWALTQSRHRQAVEEAIDWYQLFLSNPSAPIEIRCESLRQALISLSKITGKILADDVLGAIFSQFCIGK